jgi:hypothetical protein
MGGVVGTFRDAYGVRKFARNWGVAPMLEC